MTRKLPTLNPEGVDQTKGDPQPFRAVEIRAPESSCAAAKALNGRRFLCAEAPLLPLGDCDRSARCRCCYRHRRDRRSGSRRCTDAGLATPRPTGGFDRRERGVGRRAEDFADTRAPWSFEEEEEALNDPLADTYYEFVAGKFPKS
jgi:hypothetical protein